MTAADVERAADLCTQLGYPSTASDVAPRFQAIAARADHAVFVAEDDARVVGAELAPFDDRSGSLEQGRGAPPSVVGWVHVCAGMLVLESDPWAEIGGLVVDERVRGRGVGDRLLAAAEAWAREQGYPQVRLRSNVVREAAHQFYLRRGYEVFKTQLNFRKAL